MRESKGCKRIQHSFPFKGKAGMGMGHSVPALTTVMREARLWRSRYPMRNPATQGTNHCIL